MALAGILGRGTIAILLLAVLWPVWTSAAGGPAAAAPFRHAVVAADHPLASQAGLDILRRGGNVVDAAVATSFALSVLRPESCGLGGGGFMLIWNADRQEAIALDYRERAPRAASRDMFLDPKDPSRPRGELSRKGHLAVAVPGTVAGLCYALKHYGTLDLPAVLAPALRLAREGFLVDPHYQGVVKTTLAGFSQRPEYRERYAALLEQYLDGGKGWQVEDRFHSPQRKILELIAQRGRDGFYRGPAAAALVAEMRRGGGLITAEDLARTEPVVRKPVRGRVGRYELLGMPPPSSGGVALIETLNILAEYEKLHADVRWHTLGSDHPDYVHLVTEALKHALADRAEFMGDADFADVPVERLISPEYARALAERMDAARTKPAEEYGRFQPVLDEGTSHISIIDARGNAVACTETINTTFGSYVVEPEYGIVLNNQMDDFATVPGRPNAFGLIQSEANAVAAGKKPLSSMSPTILLKDGKAVCAAGASGGPRIISATLQVLLNLTWFEMTPEQAVGRPRFHHQWLPAALLLEEPLFRRLGEPLSARGHAVERAENLAAVQAVWRSGEGVRGGSDPRKHGRPAGY